MTGQSPELAGLLAHLHQLRFTGRLRLRRGPRWHSIQLRRGLLCSATPVGLFDPLGQLLLAGGKLGGPALLRSVERLAATDRLQGEILREMGLLTASDLEHALRAQLGGRVLRLLAMDPPDETQTLPSSTPARIHGPCRPLHPLALIWEHTSRLADSEAARFRRRLTGARLALRPGIEPPIWLLGRQGLELCALLRRPTSFAHLGSSPERVRMLLFLWRVGLVGRCEAPSPPARETSERRAAAGAAREQARRAFHRLALELHPDRHPTASPAERAALSERFARAAAAYHELARGAARDRVPSARWDRATN